MEIIESPALSDTTKVGNMFNQIEMLSTDELRENSQRYFDHLAQRYKNDKRLNRKWLSRIAKDSNFVNKMSHEEMQAIVSVEFLKYLMGKDQPFDTGSFFPASTLAQRQE